MVSNFRIFRSAGGEIWRITNASGSATYDVRLWNPAQNQDMIFQVLSIDGVGISPTPGASQQSIAQIFGHKVRARLEGKSA
jgi:FtsP/CotA-like multicopper oxidase with cupredoxin domain